MSYDICENESRKFALVVGDNDPRLDGTMDEAIHALSTQGHEIYFIGPRPRKNVDHYATPSREGIESLVAGLRGRISANDDLVVSIHSHGDAGGYISGLASLCRPGLPCGFKELAPVLDIAPYRQRTFVMGQCFGGDWASLLLAGASTLFISPTREGDITNLLSMYAFWDSNGRGDLNGDGLVSWRERYASILNLLPPSIPLFAATWDFVDDQEVHPFPTEVVEVAGPTELGDALRLEPGRRAIVYFGESSLYDRHLEEAGAALGGRIFLMRAAFPAPAGWDSPYRDGQRSAYLVQDGWAYPIDPGRDFLSQIPQHRLNPDDHSAALREKWESSTFGSGGVLKNYLSHADEMSEYEIARGVGSVFEAFWKSGDTAFLEAYLTLTLSFAFGLRSFSPVPSSGGFRLPH